MPRVVERSRYATLFQRLVDTSSADRPASNTATSALAERLEPLRNRPNLQVVSLAVNGERVDVVARDGDEEWRVVFGTPDGQRVEWLDVYQRPHHFAGVAGGAAVVVNGPSSAGKSSLLQAIRLRSAAPWVVFDEPFFGAVNPEWLIWRERAEVVHRGFLDGIAALARAGNSVGVAAGGHPPEWFDRAFTGVRVVRIGLECDPDELARRERGRNDVAGGLATSSPEIHAGWQYDLRCDTTACDSSELADSVLEIVDRLVNEPQVADAPDTG